MTAQKYSQATGRTLIKLLIEFLEVKSDNYTNKKHNIANMIQLTRQANKILKADKKFFQGFQRYKLLKREIRMFCIACKQDSVQWKIRFGTEYEKNLHLLLKLKFSQNSFT